MIDLAKAAKLDLDPWQAKIIEYGCATRREQVYNQYTERNENLWAAKIVAVMVSRQNGKGSICEARQLAGLFLLGDRLQIHSAHQFDTSIEAFNRLLFLIEDNPDFERDVKRIARSHGEEGIEMKNGQRIRFRTRTKGGGRGFTADTIYLDEDMFLSSEQVGALMPTLSARPNPQLWCLGSAGTPDSTYKGKLHNTALGGGDERMLYAGWFANLCTPFCEPGCRRHDRREDPRTWAKTNPAMGKRISEEAIRTELLSMSPEMFDRERLGIGKWPTEGAAWTAIEKNSWEIATDERSCLEGGFVLGIDTAPDRSYTSIVASGLNADKMNHIEITSRELDYGQLEYDRRPGVQWVIPRIIELWRNTHPAAVVIDKAGQAGTFVADLESAGVNVISPTSREYGQATGDFISAVMPRDGERRTLVHLNQVPMNTAAAVATLRPLADLSAWSKTASAQDITPIVAATLALWGFKLISHVAPEPVAPWAYVM